MGWPSLFENIQDRLVDAEHFRQSGGAIADNFTSAAPPPVICAVEAAPESREDPAKRQRMRNWMQRERLARGRFEWTRDTIVWRGGAQRYTEKIKDVFIRAFDRGGPRRALQIDFKIASKGGGETHLSTRFGPQDFQTLIQAMLVADRQATLAAMTEELARNRH